MPDQNRSISSFPVGISDEYVTLTEQIQLPMSEELSYLCHLTKNLYNHANWILRKRYFFLLDPERFNKKTKDNLKKSVYSKPSRFSTIPTLESEHQAKSEKLIELLNKESGQQGYHGVALPLKYREMWGLLRYSRHYKALPSQTAQQVLKVLERDWKSYFNAIKEWRLNPGKFQKRPSTPRYKRRDGEFLAVFTNQMCKLKQNYITFPRKKLITPILKSLEEKRVWNKWKENGISELTSEELYTFETIELDNSKSLRDEGGSIQHWHPPIRIYLRVIPLN